MAANQWKWTRFNVTPIKKSMNANFRKVHFATPMRYTYIYKDSLGGMNPYSANIVISLETGENCTKEKLFPKHLRKPVVGANFFLSHLSAAFRHEEMQNHYKK